MRWTRPVPTTHGRVNGGRISTGILGCLVLMSAAVEAAPRKTDAAFDKDAAIAAITTTNLQRCKSASANAGDGHVVITFSPAGTARTAAVDKGPWVGTPVATCMAREFKKVKVPAFKGEPITVGKSFHFE